MAHEMRNRIDRALGACEEANALNPQRPARWVLELIGELQVAGGSLVWEPADTIEAHTELLDLQARYLDTPPREALAEARALLAYVRGELRQLREQPATGESSGPDRRLKSRESEVTVVRPVAGNLLAAVAAAASCSSCIAAAADLEEIAAAGGVTLALLRGRSRRPALVELRRIAVRYLRESGCSLPEIGAALNRDHTTILYLLRTDRRAAA